MKKLISLLMVATLTLSGCSKPTAPTEVKETSYSATANGYGGELKVEVVMIGTEIKDVKLVESKESSPVINRAFPVIKERILSAQSPIVDSVSGATYSSNAIKMAVADATKQGGLEFDMSTKVEEAPAKELEAVTTQIVIVGAGPAGLSAAIEAKESGVEDVILIEKLDILSGNGKFDMNFFDLINSEAQKNAGIDYTVEQFIEDKKTSTDSAERIQAWAEGENTLDAWLRGMDIQLNQSNGGTNHMAEKDAYAGEEIQDGLEKRAQELNIDIRTNTEGLDLIMDGSKAVGVKVKHGNETYDIMADAVIIATGGFSHNKELLAKYAPGSEDVATSNQMGATGDFVPVFEKNDFKMDKMDTLSVFKTIISVRRDLTGAGDGFLFVNKNGERFVDESKSGLDMAHTILEQPDGKVYYIYDQRLFDTSYRLEKHNNLGYHVKADTIEELAEKLGLPADALKATVDTYNKAIAGEVADPFRETPFTEQLSATGPYYGVQVESAIHMTKGGVVANENAQVLMSDDSVVEGLYAAGEVTATTGAYSAAVVFGRISGEKAAEFVLSK